jgi:hypothetical protein
MQALTISIDRFSCGPSSRVMAITTAVAVDMDLGLGQSGASGDALGFFPVFAASVSPL